MTDLLVDTSVAVPLVLSSHQAHSRVGDLVGGRTVGLAGHARFATYAVLTRLPGDARLSARDAARLIADRFSTAAALVAAPTGDALAVLAEHDVGGGATYDGLVALVAKSADLALASRDRRAEATYRRLGVTVEMMI